MGTYILKIKFLDSVYHLFIPVMICNIWLTFNIAVNCITSRKASLATLLWAFVLLLKSSYNTWKYSLSEDMFCNVFCKYYFFVYKYESSS